MSVLRPRNVYLAVMTGLYLWFGAIVVWAYRADASIGKMSDCSDAAAAIAADMQPDGENGWPHLKKAMETLRAWESTLPDRDPPGRRRFRRNPNEFDEFRPELDFGRANAESPAPGDVETLLRTVDALESLGVFEHFARAARCPQLVVVYKHGYPEIISDRAVSPLLHARWLAIYAAMARGDETEAVSGVAETLSVAQRLAYNDVLLFDLVAAIYLERLAAAVWTDSLSDRALHALLDVVLRHQPISIEQLARLKYELTTCRLHGFYTDNGRGSGWAVPSQWYGMFGDTPSPLLNLTAFAYASERQAMERAREHTDELLRGWLASPGASRYDPDSSVRDSFSWRYEPLRVLAWDGLECSYLMPAAQIRGGLVLTLALELHKRAHGSYPASLDELVPEQLEEIPLDPYLKRPFSYRLAADDASGREYMLWSTGLNGMDEQGAGDDLFNEAPGAGAVLHQALTAVVEAGH